MTINPQPGEEDPMPQSPMQPSITPRQPVPIAASPSAPPHLSSPSPEARLPKPIAQAPTASFLYRIIERATGLAGEWGDDPAAKRLGR